MGGLNNITLFCVLCSSQIKTAINNDSKTSLLALPLSSSMPHGSYFNAGKKLLAAFAFSTPIVCVRMCVVHVVPNEILSRRESTRSEAEVTLLGMEEQAILLSLCMQGCFSFFPFCCFLPQKRFPFSRFRVCPKAELSEEAADTFTLSRSRWGSTSVES